MGGVFEMAGLSGLAGRASRVLEPVVHVVHILGMYVKNIFVLIVEKH